MLLLSCARRTSSWGERMTDTPTDTGAWRDPLVAEVRSTRLALFAAAGYDIHEFCRRLRDEQAASGHHVVTRPPRKASDQPEEAA